MHPDLSVRMQRHLHRRRRHHDRVLHPGAQHLGGEIDTLRIDCPSRHEVHPVERLAVAPDRELGAIAMRRVVIDHERDVGKHHRLEIERAHHLVESGHPLVVLVLTRIHLRRQSGQRRRGENTGQPGDRLAP
jgi:hypothetical protein